MSKPDNVRCGTCVFYRKQPADSIPDSSRGECRRTLASSTSHEVSDGFWCGEWSSECPGDWAGWTLTQADATPTLVLPVDDEGSLTVRMGDMMRVPEVRALVDAARNVIKFATSKRGQLLKAIDGLNTARHALENPNA